MSGLTPRDERKCLAPTFVRDGEIDEGKYRNCELRQGHAGNHSTTYDGKRHDWTDNVSALTAAEVERVLAALDSAPAQGWGCTPEEVAADAARLLRAAREDFEKYGHLHGWNCDRARGRIPVPRPPANGPECSCGLAAARARWCP